MDDQKLMDLYEALNAIAERIRARRTWRGKLLSAAAWMIQAALKGIVIGLILQAFGVLIMVPF